MWPNQPLPLTLLLEAFYLDLKAFEMKVGFCPAAIFKFNSIAETGASQADVDACNLFFQEEAQLPDESKRCACGACVRRSAFATKYHVARIQYPDGRTLQLPEPVYSLHEVG